MSVQNILVCVTQQKTCARLIHQASQIERNGGSIFVLHVLGNNDKFLNNSKESEALDYLFTISKSVDASMTVQRSDDIMNSIAEFIRSNNIHTAILGESPGEKSTHSFANALQVLVPDCKVITVLSHQSS